MVVDTSAILAIFADEPERRSFNEKIATAERRLISAGSYLETAIVVDSRYRHAGSRELQFFMTAAALQIIPFDGAQAELARAAYGRYGKGRHPAGLNFGDCFAYALAKLTGDALLFKGNDFSKTDIRPHPASGTDLTRP